MRTVIAFLFLCLGSFVFNQAAAQQNIDVFFAVKAAEKIDTLKAKDHITVGVGGFNVELSYDRRNHILYVLRHEIGHSKTVLLGEDEPEIKADMRITSVVGVFAPTKKLVKHDLGVVAALSEVDPFMLEVETSKRKIEATISDLDGNLYIRTWDF